MNTLLSAVGSLLSFRARSRASLELELVALRHQLTVLRRLHPGQPRLFSADRLLWVWLYRIWPQVLDAMVRCGEARELGCAALMLMPASAAGWAVGRGRARKHRVCSKLRSLTQRDNDMAASKRAFEGTNRVERSQSHKRATAKAPAPRQLNGSNWYRKWYPIPQKR